MMRRPDMKPKRKFEPEFRRQVVEELLSKISTPAQIVRKCTLWADAGNSDPGFDIISEYAKSCKYKNCTHENEPGCAVKDAAERGIIAGEVMRSFFKFKKEMFYTASKIDEKLAVERKKNEKNMGKLKKNYKKYMC
jgi:ribosome biogenesis GTPase